MHRIFLFCSFLAIAVLPTISHAKVDTSSTPNIIVSQSDSVLGVTTPVTTTEKDLLIKQQIIKILQQIQSLQAFLRIISVEPNYTFRDNSNDLEARYTAPVRAMFTETEDEEVEVLGLMYDVILENTPDTPGVYIVTDESNELLLSFFDFGIQSAMSAGGEEFIESLPAGVALTETNAKQTLNGVTLTKNSQDYNGNAVLGMITGRYTADGMIHTATMPFSNMNALREEMHLMSEEEAVTMVYTLTRNTTIN